MGQNIELFGIQMFKSDNEIALIAFNIFKLKFPLVIPHPRQLMCQFVDESFDTVN